MIKIDKISFGYSQSRQIYEKFYITIRRGEFLSVIGPSGCGKTTLCKLIAGYLKPDTGHIEIRGKKTKDPDRDRIMINQEHDLFDWMTVYGNMRLVAEDSEMINKYLSLVKLDNVKDAYVGELSGGMKKRLSLARALAVEPEFIILDEPFSSLDGPAKEDIQEELSDIFSLSQKSALLVTHDIEEAVFMSDRIVVLDGNHPAAIKEEIVVPFAQPRKAAIKREKSFSGIIEAVRRLS